MKHDKCVGCNKKLNPGEFVVLNGGAMIKTLTGAVMGDHRHLGFLTVNNHFDSKKNYRTMVITDNAPSGQFEFYACSHKCLADFITKYIMNLSKIDKAITAKKFEYAPQSKIDEIGYGWGLKVVNLMGFKRALITDESTIGDFMGCFSNKFKSNSDIKEFSKKLGFKIKRSDYIWKIAKKLKNSKINK